MEILTEFHLTTTKHHHAHQKTQVPRNSQARPILAEKKNSKVN